MIDKALNSLYIIDGIVQEFTPNQLLGRAVEAIAESINDETLDPPVKLQEASDNQLDDYLGVEIPFGEFPIAYSASQTRLKMASSLLNSLLKEGKYRLGNLQIKARWDWNEHPIGSMTAFYESVKNVADYADALGLSIDDYVVNESPRHELIFENSLYVSEAGDNLDPYIIDNAKITAEDQSPRVFVPDAKSWIVYIPFDPADFRLGGSALARNFGLGGTPPNLSDADYFIDCFEVVREFVEDDILLAATPVGEGGLYTALCSMADGDCGLKADISGIMSSYQESSRTRVLFSEIPGVIIQIRDSDFDYVDAQLLLQDVAYFPLGHPVMNGGMVEISSQTKTGIQTILESLMLNAEGED